MNLIISKAPPHINVLSDCPNGHPQGYTRAASGAPIAYKLLSEKMNFSEAKQACQNEGTVLAMPRTVEDISDIKLYDREYIVCFSTYLFKEWCNRCHLF